MLLFLEGRALRALPFESATKFKGSRSSPLQDFPLTSAPRYNLFHFPQHPLQPRQRVLRDLSFQQPTNLIHILRRRLAISAQ